MSIDERDRRGRGWGARLLGVARLALTLAAGVALGLAVTALATRGQPPFGAVRSGVWTAWPGAGTPEADPYARATFAHDGRIPLAAAAGLRFLARRDDDGTLLERGCVYAIGGPTAPAQFWTLTLLDPSGHVLVDQDRRSGFTSSELVRDADGGFIVTIARTAHPGNWLPTTGDGAFVAMLSFYDSPVALALLTGNPAPPLPAIKRVACP